MKLLLFLVNARGELTVLQYPNGILFKGHDPLKESILSEVYSAALGFTTEQVCRIWFMKLFENQLLICSIIRNFDRI